MSDCLWTQQRGQQVSEFSEIIRNRKLEPFWIKEASGSDSLSFHLRPQTEMELEPQFVSRLVSWFLMKTNRRVSETLNTSWSLCLNTVSTCDSVWSSTLFVWSVLKIQVLILKMQQNSQKKLKESESAAASRRRHADRTRFDVWTVLSSVFYLNSKFNQNSFKV